MCGTKSVPSSLEFQLKTRLKRPMRLISLGGIRIESEAVPLYFARTS